MADTTDSSGIPLLGPVIDLLNNILSNASRVDDLARAVDQVEQNTWANSLNVAGWAFGAFGGVLGTLGDLLKSLAKLFENLFGSIIYGFLKNLLRKILDWITKLRNWIRVHIAAWQKIQHNLDAARSQYFRKIIDIVQRIRKILVPFRLLHLKFAQQLDARLVGIESDLGRAWAKLIMHNNQVQAVLDEIVDPRKLLRPGATLGSIGVMIGAIHGAIGAADLRTLLCLTGPVAASPLVAPWSTYSATVLAEVQTHSGDQAQIEAARDQTSRDIALDWGVST